MVTYSIKSYLMNINKKLLTVFTPSYNRADLLPRGYEALLRQTSHDFCWIIIDDGSKDHTRDLVHSWLTPSSLMEDEYHIRGVSKDAPWLQIHYCYKENGGLHTGYNKAIELMDTEICVCIDSDDYIPDNGVEKMIAKWEECRDMASDVAGVIGLDYYDQKFVPIGGRFSTENTLIHLMDITAKYGHHGDTKIVCRVDLLKKHWPMPSFKGEKNFNPFYYYLQIDNAYRFYIVNENFCNVDYQEGGMSANIFNQFYNSPRSFACLREEIMRQKRLPVLMRLKNAMYFDSSIIFTGELGRVFKSPAPCMTVLMFPLGVLFNLYVRYKKTV